MSAISGSATINGLLPYSMYNVTIVASNPLGNGTTSVNGSACTSPGSPTIKPNVTLTSNGNTTASLNLVIPQMNIDKSADACPESHLPREYLHGPFHGYRLTVETLNPPKVVKTVSIDNKTKTHEVSQLTPYTNYRVNVSVSNGRIFGPPASVNFTTAEGLPEPPHVIIEGQTVNSIKVQVIASDNRGNITGYRIKVCSIYSPSPYYFHDFLQV